MDRQFSVRIYNVPVSQENRIFYAMNQEGKKADPTRSKWLHRVGVTKLAGALVEQSPHLRDNVDTVRDRMSKRNPRLCAFNTLSNAFEAHWTEIDPDDEATMHNDLDYLIRFWEKLVEVRSELGKSDITRRKNIRETSLVDSALAITAYVALARKMREEGIGLVALEKLAQKVVLPSGKSVDALSRENPLWQKIGVLVPATKKNGTKVLNLRNARQSREATLEALANLIGVDLKDAASRRQAAALAS